MVGRSCIPFDSVTSLAFTALGVFNAVRLPSSSAWNLPNADVLLFTYVNMITWGLGSLVWHGWGTLAWTTLHLHDLNQTTVRVLHTPNPELMVYDGLPMVLGVWSASEYLTRSVSSRYWRWVLWHYLLLVAALCALFIDARGAETFHYYVVLFGASIAYCVIRLVFVTKTKPNIKLAIVLFVVGGLCYMLDTCSWYISTHGLYHICIAWALTLSLQLASTHAGELDRSIQRDRTCHSVEARGVRELTA